jgi:hypothetical protein
MGILWLDDRTQLALLLAGLVEGAGLALGGCDHIFPYGAASSKDAPWVVDPLPADGRVDARGDAPLPADGRVDARRDGRVEPRTDHHVDARRDAPPADRHIDVRRDRPPLPDARADARGDLPRDGGFKKKDHFVVDMVPFDGLIVDPLPSDPVPPQPRPGAALPLPRDLRASIRARRDGAQIELVAQVAAKPGSVLTYRWKVSGGTLDRSDRSSARWTLPTARGRHMAQLTVRDRKHTVSVDAFICDVR